MVRRLPIKVIIPKPHILQNLLKYIEKNSPKGPFSGSSGSTPGPNSIKLILEPKNLKTNT